MPLALLLALAAPPAALVDQPAEVAIVHRAERHGEPGRAAIEYVASLAAFTLVNATGAALLDGVHITVAKGQVDLNGNGGRIGAAAACFALSPFAAALTSWAIGKGSGEWSPSLGWSTLGAYGASLVAVGAGFGMAAANVDRDAATVADGGLYLLVPLGSVALMNATKQPLP